MRVVARGRLGVYEVKGEYQIICDAPRTVTAWARCSWLSTSSSGDSRPRGCSTPRASARCPCCRAESASSRRSTARPSATSSASSRARHPTARVVVRPRGCRATARAADLIRALMAIARVPDVDVVIIGRGGGSRPKTSGPSTTKRSRARSPRARCRSSRQSGHEVDFTIADFVADVRAATPSNAAELVVERADHFRDANRSRRAARWRAALGLAVERRSPARLEPPRRAAPALARRLVVMRERDRQELALRLERRACSPSARARAPTVRTRSRAGSSARDVRRGGGRAADAPRPRPTAGCAAERGAAVWPPPPAVAASSPRGSTPSARWPSSAAATRVCWNAAADEYHSVGRDVTPGDGVRVTLADGELTAGRTVPRSTGATAIARARERVRHGRLHQGLRVGHRRAREDRQAARGRRPARSTSRWRSSNAASSCRATATTSSAPPSAASRVLTERGDLKDAVPSRRRDDAE